VHEESLGGVPRTATGSVAGQVRVAWPSFSLLAKSGMAFLMKM